MTDPTRHLAFAWGGPAGSGLIRCSPEDFEVTELPGFTPSGEGEHLLVRVRKRDLDTFEVAHRLARAAGVPPRSVSFAGLKDRHAVTVQTFSIHLPGLPDPDLSRLEEDGRLAVLECRRHHRKLRRGALAGNRFRIRVRGFRGDRERLEARLARIVRDGVPNYFGPQRFGRDGRNLDRAWALLRGELRRVKREQRSLWLSAARALLFNQVLRMRVARGDWNRALAGEVLQPEGSRGQFRQEAGTELAERVARGEVHPTGPLWGRPGKALLPGDEAAAVESTALEGYREWQAGLERLGLEMDRRALRAPVRGLSWEWERETLVLAFSLGRGSYATSVLRELVEWG